MKENIRHILKETVMEKIIDRLFPTLNGLKKRTEWNSRKFGTNEIYYDSMDRTYYFRVSQPRSVVTWSHNEVDTVVFKEQPKTLYMDGRTYDGIIKLVPSQEWILEWFNSKYKQDAGQIIRRSPLKN
jgi:hypothetical protein